MVIRAVSPSPPPAPSSSFVSVSAPVPSVPLVPLVRLVDGDLHAEIAPEIGGAIAAFWSFGKREPRMDWLRPATPGALARGDILGMASFPLVPFCNRIRDGRARFEGREIRMAPNHPSLPSSPHPLHGIGWQRPWTVLARTDTCCELGLYVPASEAWPWRFSAMQRIELLDGVLQVGLSILNEDTVAMPAGLGHHPYFPRGAGTRLACSTAAMWRADGEVMPVALETGGIVDRLRAGLALDEADLDNNFVGWDRHARIDWPAQGDTPARSLRIEADPVLDHFVVYAPPGGDHFCAEPVSQCTDWLNLLDRYGRGPLGGARLAAGEPLAVSFRLVPG